MMSNKLCMVIVDLLQETVEGEVLEGTSDKGKHVVVFGRKAIGSRRRRKLLDDDVICDVTICFMFIRTNGRSKDDERKLRFQTPRSTGQNMKMKTGRGN